MRTAAALLAVGLLLPTAGTALADTPAGDDSLPGVTQLRRDASGKPAGCLPPSTKRTSLTPWPQTFLRPDRVWPLSQGDGVTVAVLGSGVTDGTGLLAGRLDYAPKLTGGGDPARDCVGHGTFLAGLIAADRRDGTGFAGLAPRARILAVSVTDDGGATTADLLAQGITAASERGVRIIAVGAALPAGNDALAGAVRAARSKGAVIVAPAAPDVQPGSGKPGPAYPAAYGEVLAVRDLAPGGALPSGAGAVPIGGRVDLAAPGDAVTGTGPSAGGNYTGAGPSFAAAFVAATAALTLGSHPDLTADQLIRRLETTAYHTVTTPDPQVGYGTIDPVAAVTQLSVPDQAPPAATPAALAMPPAPPASTAPTQAVVISLAALAVIALVAAAGAVTPRARARGWRPGRAEDGQA
ncbi:MULTISPECIES: S8 family serine peptidase [unclassified Kitasatospora]|uniref:S8 family serine peptidase n=1 Tax=unclassified Kitasatospora TaxID=2633591 RepID=UPI0037FB8361